MYSCVSGLSLLIQRVFCKHGIDESLDVKIFKGWPPRDAPSKLVQLWYMYKIFLPDQRGQLEMKKPTILSNKTNTA